jgi:hypothetical protein
MLVDDQIGLNRWINRNRLGIEFGSETNKKKYKQKVIGLFHGVVKSWWFSNLVPYLGKIKAPLLDIPLPTLTSKSTKSYQKTNIEQKNLV